MRRIFPILNCFIQNFFRVVKRKVKFVCKIYRRPRLKIFQTK